MYETLLVAAGLALGIPMGVLWRSRFRFVKLAPEGLSRAARRAITRQIYGPNETPPRPHLTTVPSADACHIET